MADLKKFLDQDGVSTLWTKIADKVAADVAAEASARTKAIEAEVTRAQLAETDIADDVANLSSYVGTFTHDTAKSVVEYINAKTDGIATSGNLEALAQRVTTAENDIDAIQADYLKVADKTELSNAIAAEKTRAEGVEGGLETRLTAVENDYLKNVDKTALQDSIDGVTGRVTTLEGNDAGKSVRTIANEELAKQLIADDAKESLDTLAEIAAWIQAHPEDASAMNAAIEALQAKVDTGDKTVSAYVTDAINALSIGDYAKAADLTALAARVKAVEDDYLKTADKTELSNAILLKADKTALDTVSDVANAAAVKTDVDTALAKKADQTALEAEVTARQNAVTANSDAISGIKNGASINNFASVETALANKQDVIPANTYDAYGAAAQALADAKAYTDAEINAKVIALTTAEIEAAIASATV